MQSRSALAACIAGSLLWGRPRQHPPRPPTWQREFHLAGPAAIARVKPQNAAGTLGGEELRFLEEFNRVGDSLERAGYLIAVCFRDTILVIPPSDSFHLLRDLPDVVRRLEGDAQRLRRRLDDLQDALGDPGTGTTEASRPPASDARGAAADRIVAALERERDVVQRRFGEAVQSLETIRLNVLRLHAGSGSVQSLTTDLGLAREVAAEIGRQLAAQQEIDEALR